MCPFDDVIMIRKPPLEADCLAGHTTQPNHLITPYCLSGYVRQGTLANNCWAKNSRGSANDDVIKWKQFPPHWPFVDYSHKREVTRNFDLFVDLRLQKRLSKQLRPRWLETQWRSSLCHWNVKLTIFLLQYFFSTGVWSLWEQMHIFE